MQHLTESGPYFHTMLSYRNMSHLSHMVFFFKSLKPHFHQYFFFIPFSQFVFTGGGGKKFMNIKVSER